MFRIRLCTTIIHLAPYSIEHVCHKAKRCILATRVTQECQREYKPITRKRERKKIGGAGCRLPVLIISASSDWSKHATVGIGSGGIAR